MIRVMLRGDADIEYHRRKKDQEFDMVDIWAHLEDLQEGELPLPCKIGKCGMEYFRTGQDAIYGLYYTVESSDTIWVENIVLVSAGKRR